MPTLSTVILTTKGECRKANLQLTSEVTLTIEIIQKYFKKKEEPEMVCSYEHENKNIYLFGYKKGKKGTENKTELPDPYSDLVLFGDALVVVSGSTGTWESPIPYTTDQWNSFYQQEEEEEEEEEDEEMVSDEEKSVKDAFEESDSELHDKEDAEEAEAEVEAEVEDEAPVVVKRKRAAYSKVDTSALKEEISIQSEPETNPLRLKCINAFSFLENFFENGLFTKEDIRSLEKGIFEATYQFAQKQYIARSWKAPTFCEVYRQTLRAILSNIHPQSPVNNTRLLLRVKEGEFPLSAIPFMNAYEMYPEKWFALKDKLLQREQKILEGNKSRATDQFKCRRCHKKECTYYELQTRSADEPMTIFITCLNCGKEWRQGG
uniref:TFIIS-type domain-containing protein n=1 Tax=viral metagenome TaxID=1070528 RepID=A0A6C0IG97_9ZZZZ